jgi:uncharacterized protein
MKKTYLILILIALSSICFAAVNTVSLQYVAQEKYDGRDLKLIKVLAEEPAYRKYYVTYMSGKLKISGIMDIPRGTGPFPVIITAHGFIDPKYYTNGRGLKREQDYFAKHGYAVLHPDYRNNADSSKDPDNNLRLNLGYTEDVINAVYAVRDSGIDVIDKNNIGLLGHSLGGGVALNMMIAKPGLIKAYVLFAPVSIDYRLNFERWIGRRDHNVPAKYGTPSMREKIIATYGSPGSNPEFWDNVSPKTFLNKVTEPVMVHHGTVDQDVPIEWSYDLTKELKANSKDVTFYTYKGEKHEFIGAWPLVMKRSLNFFNGYLKVTNK